MDKYTFNQLWNRIQPSQHMEEFKWTLSEVEKIAPKNILEIGLFEGGATQYWWELVKHGGLFVGIDPKPQQSFFHNFIHMPITFYIINGYSDMDSVKKEVRQILNGEKFDFIHIDGDHKIPHLDYENYIDCLRDGGLISFHDINNGTTGPIVHYLLNSYGWDRAYNFVGMEQSSGNLGTALMWKKKTGRFDVIGKDRPGWYKQIEQNYPKSNV